MSQTAIATAYTQAADIVHNLKIRSTLIIGIWEKLNRIERAISASASAQLAETLN